MKHPLGNNTVHTWTLLCVAAVAVALSIGAQQARAQIQVGCAQTLEPVTFYCQWVDSGCPETFGEVSPSGTGLVGWISQVEDKCCGYPVQVVSGDGECQIAAPQSQASRRSGTGQLARVDTRDPASGGSSGFRHEPQPVYIRDCHERYLLYVPPPSP